MPQRIFISHGMTNIDNPQDSHFKCPRHVKIYLFEHPGQYFRKLDAGLIINWLMSKLRDGANIDNLKSKILNIPLYWAKDYMSRVFEYGDKVPNIHFSIGDSNVQCGLFRLQHNDTFHGSTFFKFGFRLNNPAITQSQFNQHLLQNQGNLNRIIGITIPNLSKLLSPELNSLLGRHKLYNGLQVFEKPRQTLANVLKTLMSQSTVTYTDSNPLRLYIVSCRGYTSPKLQQAVTSNNIHPKIAQQVHRWLDFVGSYSTEEYTKYIQKIDLFNAGNKLSILKVITGEPTGRIIGPSALKFSTGIHKLAGIINHVAQKTIEKKQSTTETMDLADDDDDDDL